MIVPVIGWSLPRPDLLVYLEGGASYFYLIGLTMYCEMASTTISIGIITSFKNCTLKVSLSTALIQEFISLKSTSKLPLAAIPENATSLSRKHFFKQ